MSQLQMSQLQTALDAVTQSTHGHPDAEIVTATIRGLVRGYHVKWHNSDYSTVSVEEEFHLPIVNPSTGRPSRTFTQAGKKDGIIQYNPTGKRYLLEHKTCSEDISDPDSTYWRRLAIDSQVSCYVLANWQLGQKLDGTLYDVIRKPGIRPKKLSKGERQQVVVAGEYFGIKVSMATREWLAANESENGELFEARLSADTMERPDWYFQRRVIPRLDSDVLEYAHDCYQTANAIRDARQTGHWFRNTGACVMYGTPCEFLSICSGHDSFDSDKWRKRERSHDELSIGITVPRDDNILTYSSMQCFKTCRRKYQYRYELGYERAIDEESQALYFGTVFHLALAAWWEQLRIPTETTNDYGTSSSPVSEVGERASETSVPF